MFEGRTKAEAVSWFETVIEKAPFEAKLILGFLKMACDSEGENRAPMVIPPTNGQEFIRNIAIKHGDPSLGNWVLAYTEGKKCLLIIKEDPITLVVCDKAQWETEEGKAKILNHIARFRPKPS